MMDHLSLFKPGRSKYWYIQYRTPEGARMQKSTRCTHKADALKVFADFKKFLAEDRRKPKQTTLSAFTTEFLAYARTNFSRHTAYLYDHTLGHFKRICGDLDLSKITVKHFDTYKVTRLNECVTAGRGANGQKRTLSPITINIELRTLRSAMNTAARWELIMKNPFEKLPLISIPKTTPAFMTVTDAENLLSHIEEPWMKDFVIFAINTGMRRGELLSLRWSDIDKHNRVARITNRKDFTTKSGEQRIVSLNDAALLALERREILKGSDFVFTDADGRKLLKDRVTHAFKAAARAAGLPEELHLHSTRHSFASLLVGSGTSLFTVAKLLGHSDTKTSEIYSHLLPQHLQNEVGKINIGIPPTLKRKDAKE